MQLAQSCGSTYRWCWLYRRAACCHTELQLKKSAVMALLCQGTMVLWWH